MWVNKTESISRLFWGKVKMIISLTLLAFYLLSHDCFRFPLWVFPENCQQIGGDDLGCLSNSEAWFKVEMEKFLLKLGLKTRVMKP